MTLMGSMARTKASGRHGLIGLHCSVQDPMKEVGSVLGLTDYPIHFLTLVFSSQHLLNFLLSSSDLVDKELMGFQDACLWTFVDFLCNCPNCPTYTYS